MTTDADPGSPQRRELYFFALFRVLEAGILGLVAFSPIGLQLIEIDRPALLKLATASYLAISGVLLVTSRHPDFRLRRQTAVGLVADLLALGAALFAINGGESGIAMFMVFNIGAGALILTPAASLGFAITAALVLFSEYFYNRLFNDSSGTRVAETMMFSITYLGTALFCQQLRRQLSESEALAERRGEELANLAELNELVIRRMRTGVLVVDGSHRIRLANEAAWTLLGTPSPDRRELADVAPALHDSLWQWRRGRAEVPKAMVLREGGPEVLPRFVAPSQTDRLYLVFLEDSRVYSSRAEELTLVSLGRLSASIAHEVRNPLAAISYAAQLLDESEDLPEADRRLLEIIHSQCQRMNGIVQNILGLARQERTMAEPVDLGPFARRFVEEYRQNHPLETDILRWIPPYRPIVTMVDPQHLHQVLTILVHNALTYGREPGKPAQVAVSVRRDADKPGTFLEVIDRGPGIPPTVAQRIFAPFYTTSEHGTGLGLYIAQQLCEANQSVLSFEPVPGGGSCFRICLPPEQSLAG